MDFLIEKDGEPVPDLTTMSSSTAAASSASSHNDMDVDDEDAEALKAVYGQKGGIDAQNAAAAADAAAEAKVIKSVAEDARSFTLASLDRV
jgi:UBX domain-containing protein 1/4